VAKPATIFVVTLRAAPGRDGIRALRTLLKVALRHFGVRAISVEEPSKHPARRRRLACGCQSKQRQEIKKMDMSEYAGSRYLKVKDVKDGPIRVKIARVELGKYAKPDLHLDDGSILSANATNVRILCRAYGNDDAGWTGCEIELALGEIEFKGAMQEAIIVNPITPAKPKGEGAAKAAKKAKASRDLDDEVAF
jgi:hypothetical protein